MKFYFEQINRFYNICDFERTHDKWKLIKKHAKLISTVLILVTIAIEHYKKKWLIVKALEILQRHIYYFLQTWNFFSLCYFHYI